MEKNMVDSTTLKGLVFFGIKIEYKDLNNDDKIYEYYGYFKDGEDYIESVIISK